MADTGLLGVDPNNLGATVQGLLSQMGPSQLAMLRSLGVR